MRTHHVCYVHIFCTYISRVAQVYLHARTHAHMSKSYVPDNVGGNMTTERESVALFDEKVCQLQ